MSTNFEEKSLKTAVKINGKFTKKRRLLFTKCGWKTILKENVALKNYAHRRQVS
jgi:hypothetical protein